MRYLIQTTLALALLLISGSASAAVCVKLDEERDNLKPSERLAVKTFVEDALQQEGLSVATDDCAQTYTVYSLRLGNSVTANIVGPEGEHRSQKAANLEELPETYSQITRAMVQGAAEGQMAGVNRQNVTKKQAAPRRVKADNLFYARLGYGTILGGDLTSGPAFGFGWRYELDQMGIDISIFNMIFDEDDADGAAVTLARLGVLYFFDPVSDSTFYLNGALSYGFSGVTEEIDGEQVTFADNGLQGEAGFGYEFLRASTIRVFVEANAVLPFYASDAMIDGEEESRYTPTFTLSLGLGYDPDPSPQVEVYD